MELRGWLSASLGQWMKKATRVFAFRTTKWVKPGSGTGDNCDLQGTFTNYLGGRFTLTKYLLSPIFSCFEVFCISSLI